MYILLLCVRYIINWFILLTIISSPEGQEFSVPMEDVRIRMPSVGDVVSFSFEIYARRDVPARPIMYRIRTDVSWEDVVHNFYQENKYLNGV